MMDLEQIEFTMEEVLTIHREWIAKLYVQERKTEAEITNLLSHQKLIVTVDQVQKCIQDWNLEPLPSYPSIPSLEKFITACSYAISNTPAPSQQNGNNSHLKQASTNQPTNPSSTPRTFTTTSLQTVKIPTINLHITPMYPADQDRYTTRVFPSVYEHPSHRIHPPPRKCMHGYVPSYCPEVRSHLASLPTSGPSSLDLYTETMQFHEKIAFSLIQEGDIEKYYVRDINRSRGIDGGHVRYIDQVRDEDFEDDNAAYTCGARGDELGVCKRQKKEDAEADFEENSLTGLTPEFDDEDDDGEDDQDLDVLVYDDLYGEEDEDSVREEEELYEVRYVRARDRMTGGGREEREPRVRCADKEKKRKRADGKK